MTIEARIRELGNRHRNLEDAIHQALQSPSVDSLMLRDMKRRKLRLKEEIRELETRVP
ncbi:MAG: YdcH family protein [Brevundimonas sp.]|uniref:YdcH family protein n=1 Tax=Brevundimonas sp. TaxID=1871086 RepID=UPI0022C80388|nr:DUF465 domain-containing protein [Brevundimonas sp.]MCZ8192914.1 DUF465 domain-containing protein [Brevundimonas sp.]